MSGDCVSPEGREEVRQGWKQGDMSNCMKYSGLPGVGVAYRHIDTAEYRRSRFLKKLKSKSR